MEEWSGRYSQETYCDTYIVTYFLQSADAVSVLVRAGGHGKLLKPLLNILFRNDNYCKFQVSPHCGLFIRCVTICGKSNIVLCIIIKE